MRGAAEKGEGTGGNNGVRGTGGVGWGQQIEQGDAMTIIGNGAADVKVGPYSCERPILPRARQ